MRLSFKWLGEYVDLTGITPEELAEKMTTAGLEVEGIEPLAQGTNLVIGEVLDCWPHPDSDHLHLLKVSIGLFNCTRHCSLLKFLLIQIIMA